MNAKSFLGRIVKASLNEELEIIIDMAQKEQNRRAEKRIRDNRYAPLDEREIEYLSVDDVESAVLNYKERTKCPLVMAQKIVELANDKLNGVESFLDDEDEVITYDIPL
jgi:hypothetical protein